MEHLHHFDADIRVISVNNAREMIKVANANQGPDSTLRFTFDIFSRLEQLRLGILQGDEVFGCIRYHLIPSTCCEGEWDVVLRPYFTKAYADRAAELAEIAHEQVWGHQARLSPCFLVGEYPTPTPAVRWLSRYERQGSPAGVLSRPFQAVVADGAGFVADGLGRVLLTSPFRSTAGPNSAAQVAAFLAGVVAHLNADGERDGIPLVSEEVRDSLDDLYQAKQDGRVQ